MDKLGVQLQVGDAAKIRAQQVRKKKNDREDARLIRQLLIEDRFPQIWVIDPEGRDLRQVLSQRRRWVRTRTRIKNGLQSLAINHRLTLGAGLFTGEGQRAFAQLKLRPYARQSAEQLWQGPGVAWTSPRRAGQTDPRGGGPAPAGAALDDVSRSGAGDSPVLGADCGTGPTLCQWRPVVQLCGA